MRILFTVLIVIFGCLAIKDQFGGYEIGVLTFHINTVLIIVLTAIILSLDIVSIRAQKRWHYFIPTLLAVSFTAPVIFKMVQRSVIDNSQTIFQVTNMPKARNVWTFDFKITGRFKLTDYNLFGHTIYYGWYATDGNKITIKKSNYDGEENNFPKEGTIKGDTIFWTSADTMLVKKQQPQ